MRTKTICDDERLALIQRIAAKHIDPQWPNDGPWAEISHIIQGDVAWIARALKAHKEKR